MVGPVGHENKDEEEKLLKQAIAFSLEGPEENENEEEDINQEDGDEEEKELMQATALSSWSGALCHRSSFNPWCDVHGILFLKTSYVGLI